MLNNFYVWILHICLRQTATMHQKFSTHGWKLDTTIIFSEVEAFEQRCKDLLEVTGNDVLVDFL